MVSYMRYVRLILFIFWGMCYNVTPVLQLFHESVTYKKEKQWYMKITIDHQKFLLRRNMSFRQSAYTEGK